MISTFGVSVQISLRQRQLTLTLLLSCQYFL